MKSKSTSRSPQTVGGQVQSLVRGLKVLEQLAASSVALNLTEVAEKVRLPTSTTHRLLNTLLQLGYVFQDHERGEWSVGVKAFSVGNAYLKSRDYISAARPFMRDLVLESGETSNLAIMQEGGPVFVAQIECDEMMRMVAKLGSRAPLHASGVGKSMLAQESDNEIRQLLNEYDLKVLTPKTIAAAGEMLEELGRIRQRGFAVDDEEQSMGLRCIAANIYNEYGEVVAAISISGPVQRITVDRIDELGKLVCSKAESITLAIGGKQP
ncbi:IclR family transcriptional regulator [Hahella sp. CCB-MM4]|uniref:IclR family transcriptional regulator domain-containing protein n=1 Tax=Hahella sp. (strain CCB-MM4) TaxID=1926491 RepID=UPI000B9B5096|nr:IclR family transcriptional regulator C-terminal domain-containing protein [Hahella sp. CCB-MM4]OZG73953.1 IclR family transcriptional regulator [Hahella sp. CCB-MM4]